MSIHIRTEIVCDWCDKRVLLPRGITDRLVADYSKPKGWETVQHDMYGNCTHYCSDKCKASGLNEIQIAESGG